MITFHCHLLSGRTRYNCIGTSHIQRGQTEDPLYKSEGQTVLILRWHLGINFTIFGVNSCYRLQEWKTAEQGGSVQRPYLKVTVCPSWWLSFLCHLCHCYQRWQWWWWWWQQWWWWCPIPQPPQDCQRVKYSFENLWKSLFFLVDQYFLQFSFDKFFKIVRQTVRQNQFSQQPLFPFL